MSLEWLKQQVETDIADEKEARRKARNKRRALRRKAPQIAAQRKLDAKTRALMAANALLSTLQLPDGTADVKVRQKPGSNHPKIVVTYSKESSGLLPKVRKHTKEWMGYKVHFVAT